MIAAIRSYIRRLKPLSQEERELSYLCGAGDRLDVEFRQRQIDRGLFRY